MNAILAALTALLLFQPGCMTEPSKAPAAVPETRNAGPGTGSPIVEEPRWGIARLSVATAREKPEHMAEMGTQILMGHPIKLLEQRHNWFLVRSQDGYESWLEDGTFVRRTFDEINQWKESRQVIVVALENSIHEQADRHSPPVADVVLGNLVKVIEEKSAWLQVELPDGRRGWLIREATEDYRRWKATRHPTPDSLETTARSLLGRPYLWGGNSPKGLDCSGFTQLVFGMNGIELKRNSSQQAKEGTDVPIDADLKNLRKGDLVFFGRKATRNQPERIIHVGIYLKDKLFIHSSELVQINSLDSNSPIRDEPRIRSLVRARRML